MQLSLLQTRKRTSTAHNRGKNIKWKSMWTKDHADWKITWTGSSHGLLNSTMRVQQLHDLVRCEKYWIWTQEFRQSTWKPKGFWPAGCWCHIATKINSSLRTVIIIDCPVNVADKLYIDCELCSIQVCFDQFYWIQLHWTTWLLHSSFGKIIDCYVQTELIELVKFDWCETHIFRNLYESYGY